MSEWDLGKGQWRDSKPFGFKMTEFIEQYAEWVVYLRKDNRFKCPEHYDQATSTLKSFGDISCYCWGLGVAVSAMIVPSRITRGRTTAAMEGAVRDMPGYFETDEQMIHFPRAVLPKENDIVLVCEWNNPTNKIPSYPHHLPAKSRPVRISSIYMIKQINSHYQRELSHFSCAVESHAITANLMDSFIQNKLTNLPVLNTGDTWQQYSYWSD